jgi:thymidylate synthase
MIPSFNSIDELQLYLFQQLKEEGEIVTTRGLKTIEISSVSLRLNNIRKRCTTLNSRKWSLHFAIGEFAWHLSASNKLDAIEYYAKEWKNASPDGQSIYESCYGHKIFSGDDEDMSQWRKIIKLLKHDPYTRRAVLTLYNFNNISDLDSKDVACTCSIQFLFRNNKLDAIVYMRSNDIIWGLPNDIFFFTMLQELLANELGVEVGIYTHIVGSLHLYERHFDLAALILKSNTESFSTFEMPRMARISELENFVKSEEKIRKGELKSIEELDQCEISAYWKHLLQVLLIQKLGLPPSIISNNAYLSLPALNGTLNKRKASSI